MTEESNEPHGVMRYVGAMGGLRGKIVKVLGPILNEDGKPSGRYEIQPWVPSEGRYTWVTSDATADELQPAPDPPVEALDRDDPTTLVMTIDRDAPGYKAIFGDDESE